MKRAALFGAACFLLGSAVLALAASTAVLRPDQFVAAPWTWTGAQTHTAAITVAETHPTAYTPTLTSNNYTLQASDCGKLLIMPAGTTGATLTLFNINAACVISIDQAGANQYTVTPAGGATFNSVDSFTKTKGQHAIIGLWVEVPSVSAAVWAMTGSGA